MYMKIWLQQHRSNILLTMQHSEWFFNVHEQLWRKRLHNLVFISVAKFHLRIFQLFRFESCTDTSFGDGGPRSWPRNLGIMGNKNLWKFTWKVRFQSCVNAANVCKEYLIEYMYRISPSKFQQLSSSFLFFLSTWFWCRKMFWCF